jgi:low affinity Fe/Cu permease
VGTTQHDGVFPSDVPTRVGLFDRFAHTSADVVSRAPFFAFCMLLVATWLVEGMVRYAETGRLSAFLDGSYQLQINTTTTIITFLLVALLQNTQSRSDKAMHHKLNAIADGLADLMDHVAERSNDDDLRRDISELRLSVGLEERETSRRENTHGT